MIILDLIQNIALLIALAAIYRVLSARLQRDGWSYQTLVGLLFGGAALLGMFTPVKLDAGLIFDGRSIVLSAAGLFGGPWVALIAALMCAAYRIALGGVGVVMGVGVIIESAALGTGLYYLRRSGRVKLSLPVLAIFAFLVHAVMLALTLALPRNASALVMETLGLSILVIYPIATVLVCLLLLDAETQLADRRALAESETALKNAQKVAQVGSWTLHIAENRLTWSDEMYRIFGIERESFSGDLAQALAACIHPDDRAAVEASNRTMVEQGLAIPLEYRVVRPDGSMRVVWAEAGEPTRDKAGRPAALTGIVQDITERKRAEQAIVQSRATLQAALSSMTDGVFIADIHGDCIDLNDAFARFVRFPNRAECLRSLAEFDELIECTWPDGSLAPVETWAIPRALRGETASDAIYSMRRRDSGETWIGSYSFSPIRDESGEITGAVIVVRDITESQQVQAALRESENRYRNLIMHSPDAIVVNQDGHVALANNACLRLFGAERVEDLVGRPVPDLFLPEFSETIRQRIAAMVAGGEPAPLIEEQIVRLDGAVVDVDALAAPFNLHNGVAIHVILRDITERKRMEAELRKSHDLLTQLTEQVPGVVYQFYRSPDGRYSIPYASAGLREIFELEPEDVRDDAEPAFARLHPDDRPWLVAAIEDSARTLSLYHVEFRLILPQGGVRWGLCNAKPERTEQGGVMWHAVITDITDRKLAEQKITEQLDELRRWRSVMIGREQRNLELKREVNELLALAGQPRRYEAADG